jgi:hypothetical protein
MVVMQIDERRGAGQGPRMFERRSGGDDARVLEHFEEIGAKAVQRDLDRGVLGARSGPARRWLAKRKKAKRARVHRLLRFAGLALGAAVAVWAFAGQVLAG